jgi:hypothetical protein
MRHSGDRGIDGRIYFETKEGLCNMVISVRDETGALAFGLFHRIDSRPLKRAVRRKSIDSS